MSSTCQPLHPAFDPHWSADQFAAAAGTRLRLGRAALVRFALPASANRSGGPASARRRMYGGYAPQAALPLFRIGS